MFCLDMVCVLTRWFVQLGQNFRHFPCRSESNTSKVDTTFSDGCQRTRLLHIECCCIQPVSLGRLLGTYCAWIMRPCSNPQRKRSPNGNTIMTKLPRAVKIWTQVRKLFRRLNPFCSWLTYFSDFVPLYNRTACAEGLLNDIAMFNRLRGSQEGKLSYPLRKAKLLNW